MEQSLQGTTQAIVDLESLKARCLGNLELVDRVLKKFTAQLDGDLKELEHAISTGDTCMFAQVAHRIKGSSANIDARHLSAAASAAEQRARENCLTELPFHLEQLDRDRRQLYDTLTVGVQS